jgi:hypothetical protein
LNLPISTVTLTPNLCYHITEPSNEPNNANFVKKGRERERDVNYRYHPKNGRVGTYQLIYRAKVHGAETI